MKEDPPKIDLLEAQNFDSTSIKPSSSESLSPSKVNACSCNDWVSLDFTDSYVGEYKVDLVNLIFPKISFTLATKDDYASIKLGDTYHVDHLFYIELLTFKELHDIYRLGYNIVSKLGYAGKGWGPNEQVIWIPLDLEPHHHNTRLGYQSTS